MTVEVDAQRPAATNWKVLFPIFAIVAVDAASAGLILPLLPFYARDFGANPLTIGFLFASFAICELFAGPILGNASDRLGRKRLLLVSQIGTCASLLLLAAAPNLFVVFAARILGGLSAGNIAIAIAYVSDRSETGTRRQAIGFVSAAMGLGTMVGPALGGALAPIGLAMPFWVAAAFSLVSIMATCALLPAEQARIRRPTTTGTVPSRGLFREIAALVVLPNVKGLLTALVLLYLAFSLFTSQLALVLQARYQWGGEPLGPTEIGLLFAVAGAVNVLIQVVVIRAINRAFDERTLAAASFTLLAAGFVLIGFGSTIPELVIGVLVVASGVALARPTLVAALTLVVPPTSQGVAMGLAQSLASLINILVPIAGGFLIQQQCYVGWAIALTTLALTGLVAVGLLSMFPDKSGPKER